MAVLSLARAGRSWQLIPMGSHQAALKAPVPLPVLEGTAWPCLEDLSLGMCVGHQALGAAPSSGSLASCVAQAWGCSVGTEDGP